MANNQYANKIIYGGQTLIDLTADTIEASDVINSKTFHDKSGAPVTGTCTYDADTSDADAVASEILTGKTAYVAASKVTGTMVNNASVTGTISTVAGVYTVPVGFHDGGGSVSIAAAEQAKIIPENIREGVQILGVTGTMSGQEDVHAQSVTATPYTTAQTIIPDASQGYNYLSQVEIAAISYLETDNASGGKTITIGDVAPSSGD